MAADIDMIGLTKAVLWEETKGKLRALAIATGHRPSRSSDRYEIVERCVENFILNFESNGFHE